MTYGEFLLVFLLLPIVGLACLVMRDRRTKPSGERMPFGWMSLAVPAGLTLIAIVYTFPWDSHLITQGVWRYDSARISGVTLDWIPIEEILFFPLQTVLVWLWLEWLMPRVAHQGPHRRVNDTASGHDARGADLATCRARRLKAAAVMRAYVGPRMGAFALRHTKARRVGVTTGQWISVLVGSLTWLVSLLVLRAGWQPGTYLTWELVWALPPLILQFGVGGDLLWQRRRLLFAVLFPVVAYLSVADAVAIHQHIWTISLHQSLGLLVGGVLPIEELVFFLMTSALVACGLILGGTSELRRRIANRASNRTLS